MFDILNVPVNKPKRRIEDYSYTIYGMPKFGKSSFAAQFPDALFFGFEAGQKALPVRLVPVSDWKEFKGYVRDLQKAKKEGHVIPYRNFVIDTVGIAWKYCIDYVCRQNGWTHPSDGKMGRGWAAVADEFFAEIDKLTKLGTVDRPCTVINIAHAATNQITPKGQEEYSQIVPDVPKGARATIVDDVDFIIYCAIETVLNENGEYEEVRRMYIRNDGSFESGSRLRYMPDFIEYGNSAEEAFANFKKAFDEAIVKEFGPEDDGKIAESKPKVKETKRKTAPVKEELEPEREAEPEQEEVGGQVGLDELKADIEVKLKELYARGKTPVEIVKLVKEHTGKQRASEIDNLEAAQKLLAVAEEMLADN